MNPKRVLFFCLMGCVLGWMGGCAPSRQIVNFEPPAGTPLPVASPAATPSAAVEPAPTEAVPVVTPQPVPTPSGTSSPRTKTSASGFKNPKIDTAAPEDLSPRESSENREENGSDQAEAVDPSSPLETKAEVRVEESTHEQMPSASPRSSSPKSISRVFMGIGLFILLGGVLYALRQFQEKRSLRRNLNAIAHDRVKESETLGTEPAAYPRPITANPSPKPAQPELFEPQNVKKDAETRPTVSASTPGVRRRKVSSASKPAKSSTRKTPQKAALRISRPAVKTVRLAAGTKKTSSAGAARRKKA